jgi:hypothetical protein
MKPSAAILLTVAMLVAACAGSSHSHRPCTASKEAVDDYLARAAALASNKALHDVLEPHEMVYVSFALAADGSASDFRLDRPSRPAAGEEILRAAAAAAPYSRPPFDPAACLWDGRVQISIVGHIRCDETRASAYTGAVAERIQDAINSAGLTGAPEPDKVALKVKIDQSGKAIAITVHDAHSTEVGERVAALARTLSPFGAPDDSIRQCVSDHPFFVWVGLPGITRGPIFIHD